MAKCFLDTNIFFYAIDERDPDKQVLASKLIVDIAQKGEGVVSSQVVQEFSSNLIKKLRVTPQRTSHLCMTFLDYEVVKLDLDLIFMALKLMDESSVSFWDSTIVAAAQSAGCKRIYSEDMGHGERIAGMQVVNPFR